MNVFPLILKSEKHKTLLPTFNGDDPVYVFDMGYHQTPPSHTYGPAVRPYYLLHLIERGKGTVEREGSVVRLSAGEAFLICPDETVTYRSDPNDPWVYSWISFYGEFSKTLVARTTDRLYMPYRKSGLVALKTAINDESNDYMGCMNTLFEVLNSIKSEPRAKDVESDPIATALAYFENNYFRHIDVQSLAAQLGFSRAYFSTLFAERTGETPYNYLTRIRVRKAKEYLQTHTHSVEEIAYSVGFSSLQRFSEIFKKYAGLSPMQYRKSL